MNHPITEIRIGACRLNAEQASKINTALNEFIFTTRPFLRCGYSLKNLSDDMNISLHHLSAFINQYYGINFNDFINKYRVAYFIEKIKNEEWKIKKLEAIAEESGFSNRNTFSIAFRKVSGQSPSNFMKKEKYENTSPIKP